MAVYKCQWLLKKCHVTASGKEDRSGTVLLKKSGRKKKKGKWVLSLERPERAPSISFTFIRW